MNQRWSNQSTSEMLRLWVCLQSEGKCQNTHRVKTYRHWRIYLSRLWKTCSNKECFESRQRNHPQHPLYQNSLTPRTIKHQQRMGKLCINAQIVNIWTQWRILFEIMLNHITCQPHLLVLFGVTLVPPEMLSGLTDIKTSKVLMTALMLKHEYMWQRSNCDYSSPYTTSVKRHIESKQVGSVIHECDFCQHRVHTKNALSVHKTSNHADAVLIHLCYNICITYFDCS